MNSQSDEQSDLQTNYNRINNRSNERTNNKTNNRIDNRINNQISNRINDRISNRIDLLFFSLNAAGSSGKASANNKKQREATGNDLASISSDSHRLAANCIDKQKGQWSQTAAGVHTQICIS